VAIDFLVFGNSVVTEWLFVSMFMIVLSILCISELAGRPDSWDILKFDCRACFIKLTLLGTFVSAIRFTV